jgi:hypothetical protein
MAGWHRSSTSLLPYVKELERPYTADADDAILTTEVVASALGMSDYWAERTVAWLESGVGADSMQAELRTIVADSAVPRAFGTER